MSDDFRWQTFFQHAAQPIFLLNRRKRILFVNRAFETCAGLKLADLRGRVCRRRRRSAADAEDAVLSVLAPPIEAMGGESCTIRRRAPGSADWWTIQFTPLSGAQDLLGILGTIHVLAAPVQPPFTLPEKLMALRDRQAARYRLDDWLGGSPALERVREQARLAAQSRMPLVLLGPAGVGKEWLARAIHLQGTSCERYFAGLDARRLPPDLLGDVLFGPRSRQMAFGSVFLRHPELLPREWQVRLTDAVRLGADEFPRLMIGLEADPTAEIAAGRLLEEFYCAVSPVTITIPPLSDRLAQIERLIETFLSRTSENSATPPKRMSDDALGVLRAHAWPGNLRELQEAVREACRHAKSDGVELADLPFHVRHGPAPAARKLPLDSLLEQVERRLIALALKLTDNNQTRAAELLEIWRPRLMRRMEKFAADGSDK